MFVAKFSRVDANAVAFKSDKNGQKPFIGTILAGTATASLINGTMFHREGLETNKMYLCENVESEYTNPTTGEISTQINVEVLSSVSVLEFIQLKKELGAGKLKRETAIEEVAEEPLVDA